MPSFPCSNGLPRPTLHIAHDSNNLATKQAEMESQYSSVAIFEPPEAAAGIRARDPQIGTFRWKKCPIDASIQRRIAEISRSMPDRFQSVQMW
jgi:hypothetical protein